MTEKLSIYRDRVPDTIVYHNKNERPAINVPHLHSGYEIYYNIYGAEGFFFDKKFYPCDGNDLFVIPKAQVHKAIVRPDTEYERCIVSIDSKIIASINSMPHLSSSLDWLDCVGDSLPGKVNLSPAQHDELMGYVTEYNNARDELKRFAVLVNILSFTGGFFKSAKPAKTIIPESIPWKAMLVIEENFRDIKIADIAKQLFVSDSYISKVFKEECGVTLSNYLIIRKIAEAKKYLYMGVSVKEVCFLSGFNNYSNFIRTFKKFEGYSPGNFEGLTEPI